MEQTHTIEALFSLAKAHRVPMATICKQAGIDPTTPSRWKRKLNGANFESVNRLHAALNAILEEAA